MVQNSKSCTSNCFKYSPDEQFPAIYSLLTLNTLQNCAHYLLVIGKINSVTIKTAGSRCPLEVSDPNTLRWAGKQYPFTCPSPLGVLRSPPWVATSVYHSLWTVSCCEGYLPHANLSKHHRNKACAFYWHLTVLFPWPAPKTLDLGITTSKKGCQGKSNEVQTKCKV